MKLARRHARRRSWRMFLVVVSCAFGMGQRALLADGGVTITCIGGGRQDRTEFVRGETVTVRLETTGVNVTGLKLDLVSPGGNVLFSQMNLPVNRTAEFTLDTLPYACGAYQLKASAFQGATEKASATATIGIRYIRPEGMVYGVEIHQSDDDAMFDDIQDHGLEIMLSTYDNQPAAAEINAAIRRNMGFTARVCPDIGGGGVWDTNNPAQYEYFRIQPNGLLAEWAWSPGYALRLSHPQIRANAYHSTSNQVAGLAGIPAFRPYVVCNDDFAGGMYGWDYSGDVQTDFHNLTGQYPPTNRPTPQTNGPISTNDPALIWRTWFEYCQSNINAGFNLVERQAVTNIRADIKIGPIPAPMQQPLSWQHDNDGPQLYPTYDFGSNGFNLVSCYCYNVFWLPNITYSFWMELGRMGNRQMPEFILLDCLGTAGYTRNSLYHVLAGGVKGINYYCYLERSAWAWDELKHQGAVIRRIGPVQRALAPAKRDIALLDSFTSQCYNPNYAGASLFYAFANLQQAHFSVDLVAESEIVQPGFLTNYAGVVLCNMQYIPQSAYAVLTNYAAQGVGKVLMDWSVPFAAFPGATRVNLDIGEGVVRTNYQVSVPWLNTYGITGRVECVKNALTNYFPQQCDSPDIKVVASHFQVGAVPYTWFVNTHDQDEYRTFRPYYLPNWPEPGFAGTLADLAPIEAGMMVNPYTTSVTMGTNWSTSLAPYNLITGQRLPYANRQLSLSMERFGGTLVAWLPEAIGRITITGPANPAAGQECTFTATVYGVSGQVMPGIIPVEFTLRDPQGGTSVVSQVAGTVDGVATLTWTPGLNDPTGTWTIAAQDLASGATSSSNITPNASNVAPTANMAFPAYGAVFLSPLDLSLLATAADVDGTVTHVEFYADGNLICGDTNGADGWSCVWSNIPAGLHALTAQAHDDDGAVTTSDEVIVRINGTYWFSVANGDWITPANWMPHDTPVQGDVAEIYGPGVAYTASVSDTRAADTVAVGGDLGTNGFGTGMLDIKTNGLLNVMGLMIGVKGYGAMLQEGGSVTGSMLVIGMDGGSGCYTQMAGRVILTTNAASASYWDDLSDAGWWFDRGGTARVVIAGGTLNGTDFLMGNSASNNVGIVTLSGGNMVMSNLVMGNMGGTHTIVQSGGTNRVTQSLAVGQTQSAGAYSLTGGRLEAGVITVGGDSSTGIMEQAGGMLVAQNVTVSGILGSYGISDGTMTVSEALTVGAASSPTNVVFSVLGSLPSISLSNYTQYAGAKLTITLSPAGLSPIRVAGAATLAGTLEIGRADDAYPNPGTVVTMMTYAARSGAFTQTNFINGIGCDVHYNANSITLDHITPANDVPSNTLASPPNGAAYLRPATAGIALTDLVVNAQGAITNVSFYTNGTLLVTGILAAAQTYTNTWTNPPAGRYELSAKAWDSCGSAGTSLTNTIWVWTNKDIGSVGKAGSAAYTNPTYTVVGAGADIEGATDAFRFVYLPLPGSNYTLTVRVATMSNPHAWAKAGVMIRKSLNANAVNVLAAVTPTTVNGVTRQYRASDGGGTTHANTTGVAAPRWVKLARSGNSFSASNSVDGATWVAVGTAVSLPNMGTNAYVGLAVTSHTVLTLCTAVFDNVSMTVQ